VDVFEVFAGWLTTEVIDGDPAEELAYLHAITNYKAIFERFEEENPVRKLVGTWAPRVRAWALPGAQLAYLHTIANYKAIFERFEEENPVRKLVGTWAPRVRAWALPGAHPGHVLPRWQPRRLTDSVFRRAPQ
jgi:hypothetical protein